MPGRQHALGVNRQHGRRAEPVHQRQRRLRCIDRAAAEHDDRRRGSAQQLCRMRDRARIRARTTEPADRGEIELVAGRGDHV